MSIAAAALVALALPAAAHAAAFTIKAGDGACASAGDLACGSFPEASQATDLNAGLDTISVAAGTYADGTSFAGQVQIMGAPGAVVNGAMVFNGSSGLSTLQGVNVVASGPPAIAVNGSGGLAISDLTVVSTDGYAILFINSTANTIDRVSAFTGSSPASGQGVVRVDPQPGSTAGLTISSSVLVGGFEGLGVHTSSTLGGTATVTAHHVTAAGSAHGLSLNTGSLGLGTITMAVTDSIFFNPQVEDLLPPVASFGFDAQTITSGDPSALFADPANRNYHLRPGSPAIDAGDALVVGESTTDVDGDSRAGSTTDLGADEYVNTAPTAAIAVTTPIPRAGQPVAFDGGGSKDQPGGSIASYKWEFGDGATTTTAGPTVAHTYAGEGPVTVKLTVVDGEGLSSTPATKAVTVLDGTIPSVTITKPKSKQKINQFVTKTKTVTKNGKKKKVKVKTKTRTRIKFAGTASDKSGVARVVLTVEKTASAKKTTVVQGSAASTAKCRWLDPKKGLKKRSCAKPILILVKLKDDGSWAYNVRKSIKLSTGTYRAVAYGLDKTGTFGNSAAAAKRNITFKIR